MMRFPTKFLAAAVLGGTVLAVHGALAAPASGAAGIFGAVPAAAFSARLGDLDASTRLNLAFVLPLRDTAGVARFVRSASTPGSPAYGRFLSPQQFAERYGADAGDTAAVVAWAKANGLSTGRLSTAGTSLIVSGDAATIGRLFATRLASYRTRSGRPGFAPAVAPSIPPALAGKVAAVIGLVNTGAVPTLYRQRNTAIAHPDGGSGVLGGFSPADLRSIYAVPAPFTPAATQTVALFEQGGFAASDIEVYKKRYGLPDTPVIVKGVNGSPTGDVPGVDIECDIDIDMAIGIDTSLKQVLVYEDAVDPFPLAILASLTQMADDDVAQTISISYGFDEASASRGEELAVRNVALQMAAQGQTLFASSGDDGAYGDAPPALNTSFPSTDPYVTAVGGTTLFNFRGVYGGEEAWNLLGLGEGATGGGVSTVFPIPSWQQVGGTSVAAANGGSATMRNVPDVAAIGDPETGISVFSQRNGGWLIFGGTSVSSPVWAGFASVLDGARAGAGLPPLGFLNPLIYALGHSQAYGTQDVADGSNGNAGIFGVPGYNAGPGYDDTTGFGSVNLNAYAYSVLTQAHAAGSKPGLVGDIVVTPTGSGAKVTWTAAAAARGYLVTVRRADDSGPLIDAVTTQDSFAVTGLASGTAYYLYVTSLNGSGSASPGAVFFSTKDK